MKFAAILLIACVAVSQAAFTTNLRQHVQPALSQAMFQVRLVSRGDDLQTGLAQGISNTINGLIAQAQAAIAAGQAISTSITDQLSDAYNQMTGLGSSAMENMGGIISQLTSGLGSIWSSIFGKGQKFDISEILSTVWGHAQNLINNMSIQELLQAAANHVLSNLFSGKGLFGDAWNALQNGAGQAWSSLQNVFNNITTSAGAAFGTVQTMAQQMLNEAMTGAQTMTSQTAASIMAWMAPYQQDLGTLYTQLAEQLSGLIN